MSGIYALGGKKHDLEVTKVGRSVDGDLRIVTGGKRSRRSAGRSSDVALILHISQRHSTGTWAIPPKILERYFWSLCERGLTTEDKNEGFGGSSAHGSSQRRTRMHAVPWTL